MNITAIPLAEKKYKEAEKMNQRALKGYEKALGREHPDTLTYVYWLAYHLHKQKQYNVAAELYQRACDGFKKKLGPRHPTTIACFNNYSTMQKEVGQVG